MGTVEWHVGAEYDEAAFSRLGRALRSLGATRSKNFWGVAGSQELSEWKVVLAGGGSVTVRAETYMGLTVLGPEAVVSQVRDAYATLAAR